MLRLQELNAKLKPRKPDNFIYVSEAQWQRLQGTKPLRWKIVKEPEPIKIEKLTTIKTKKKKHD